MPYLSSHLDDPQHDLKPDWWGIALLALLVYLFLAVAVRGDPVPERYDAPSQRGNRGLAELREPKAGTVSLPALLRSCLPCHGGGGGPPLFANGYLLPFVERASLSAELNGILNSGMHGGWIREVYWSPQAADREKLVVALDLLQTMPR